MTEIVLPDAPDPAAWAECSPTAAAAMLEDALACLALDMLRNDDRQTRLCCAASWPNIETLVRQRWQLGYERALFAAEGREPS
jgi:hypothetical protein